MEETNNVKDTEYHVSTTKHSVVDKVTGLGKSEYSHHTGLSAA